MPCPSCGFHNVHAADGCRHCGFHLEQVKRLLGYRQVTAEPLIDHACCLSIADAQAVRMALDAFERRFPQVAITVFLGDLPEGINPAMAGVWLLNQAELERFGKVRQSSFALALIINPVTGQAGIATGYALEDILPPATIQALLGRASPLLWHREHARAIGLMVDDLDKTMRRQGRAHRRQMIASTVGRLLGLRPAERQQEEAPAPP